MLVITEEKEPKVLGDVKDLYGDIVYVSRTGEVLNISKRPSKTRILSIRRIDNRYIVKLDIW